MTLTQLIEEMNARKNRYADRLRIGQWITYKAEDPKTYVDEVEKALRNLQEVEALPEDSELRPEWLKDAREMLTDAINAERDRLDNMIGDSVDQLRSDCQQLTSRAIALMADDYLHQCRFASHMNQVISQLEAWEVAR